jgi:hypothetical protein
MRPNSADEANYRFLTVPGARLQCSLSAGDAARPELCFFGNRAGLLSLANLLLWLVANAWRREFLSFAELGFVEPLGPLSVRIRMSDEAAPGRHGRVVREDRGESLEWSITEDDLRQVALCVHHLACDPGHEYDRLSMDNGGEFEIHLRMTDAATWLAAGIT